MVKNLKGLLLIGAALVIASCAYAEVRPIKSTDNEGIRFYRPRPYLWVTLTEKGGCALSVEYLPDTSQEYIIIPHTGVGTLKVAPTLAQGWNLTALDVTADSKTAEMVNSITGLAGNIASAAIKPGVAPSEEARGPGLYRFEFTDGKVDSLKQVFSLTGNDGKALGCGQSPQR